MYQITDAGLNSISQYLRAQYSLQKALIGVLKISELTEEALDQLNEDVEILMRQRPNLKVQF